MNKCGLKCNFFAKGSKNFTCSLHDQEMVSEGMSNEVYKFPLVINEEIKNEREDKSFFSGRGDGIARVMGYELSCWAQCPVYIFEFGSRIGVNRFYERFAVQVRVLNGIRVGDQTQDRNGFALFFYPFFLPVRTDFVADDTEIP